MASSLDYLLAEMADAPPFTDDSPPGTRDQIQALRRLHTTTQKLMRNCNRALIGLPLDWQGLAADMEASAGRCRDTDRYLSEIRILLGKPA